MTAKVTSKDVAKKAGVSQATVSYVLNNAEGKHISEATRKSVLAAARELGYVPNLAARRLRTRRSNCVAVRLATALTIPRYFMALQGLRAYFEPRGYNLILFNDKKEGNAGNYLDACLNTQADGVIYISADYSGIPEEKLQELRQNNIPVSAIDCMGATPDVSSVTYDYYASTALRVEYMLERGVRSFYYLADSVDLRDMESDNAKARERTRGFLTPLEGRGDVRWELGALGTSGITNDSAHSGDNRSWLSLAGRHVPRLRQVLAALDRETALITAFPDMQDAVTRLLHEQAQVSPAAGGLPWYERSLGYEYPHYEVGFEAARSLYGVITGGGGVRKISIQPRLLPVDPSMY